MTNERICFLPRILGDVQQQQQTTRSTCSKIVRKIPMLGFVSLIIGTTIMGLTVRKIEDNQVGFYKDGTGYVESGIFFQMPWMRDDFVIVDVYANKSLLLENVNVVIDKSNYILPFCSVKYTITNSSAYVLAIQKKFNGDIHQMMGIFAHQCKFVLEHYTRYPPVDTMFEHTTFFNLNLVVDERFNITGISFNDIIPASAQPQVVIHVGGDTNDTLSIERYNQRVFEYLDSISRNEEGGIVKRDDNDDDNDDDDDNDEY